MSNNVLQTDALVQHRPDFRSAAMVIDNNLHDYDVDNMKFLCQGLVVASKLKRVDAAHELISLLESANLVTENDFFLLADLLQYIQRLDVLESIGYEEREVMHHRRLHGSRVNPFYVLLLQISEDLPDEDVRKASYMYGKVPRSHKVSSGIDLFTVMVHHQTIHPGDVGLLVQIFTSIERQDIVELINRYTATEGRSVMNDLEQSFVRAMTIRGMNLGDEFRPQAQIPQPPPSQPPKGQHFGTGSGLGPSIHDIDISDRGREPPLSFPQAVSDQFSIANQPPSVPRFPPSAPLSSVPSSLAHRDPNLPTMQTNIAPQVPAVPVSVLPVSAAPEGFSNYAIPWAVLDVLSKNIPSEYWEELSSRLGVPVTSQWSTNRASSHHKLAVLKRWLDLPETHAMESVSIKNFLIQALAYSGPNLMAQEIALELNVDFNAIMQESTSTARASVHDENDVASVGSAIQTLEGAVNQPGSLGAGDSQVAPVTRQMRELSLQGSPIPLYRMNRIPRGVCVIINNKEFYKDPTKPESRQMISREGTDVDRDKLVTTFDQLNFHVATYQDCADIDMVRLMQQMAMQDHTDFDCFVCCILTHGIQGALYGVNGMTVPIRDMTAPVRAQACPSLAGKPKLFFMQACQGREKQEGHLNDMEMDSAMVEDGPGELIPNESDFLLGYATVPGFVSYRSKTRGSWYITKLTELLNKHAYNHDILDILTLVNFEVGRGDALIDGGHYKQSPAPMYSLRKKLIFTHPS